MIGLHESAAATATQPCGVGSLDLKAMRARAEVDWIELSIKLRRATNFQTVQRLVQDSLETVERKPFVESVEHGPGGAATDFLVRIQDPACFNQLERLIDGIEKKFERPVRVEVAAIEVAIDLYSRAEEPGEVEKATLRLMRALWAEGHDRRQLFAKGRYGVRRLTWGERLRADQTLRVGNVDDPVSWRVYMKRRDAGRELPIAAWRARAEATLRGPAIAEYLPELARLEPPRFNRISKLMRFRRVRESPSPAIGLHDLIRQRDRDDMHRRGTFAHWPDRRSRRKFSELTDADVALNAATRNALRHLSSRFSAEKRAGI